MSQSLSEAWSELAAFITHKNSLDIGALNHLLHTTTQTSQQEALFASQVEAFLERVSGQTKSKAEQHSEALALLALDALLYNMYRYARGNEGFKPSSSSFYGWMSSSHISCEYSESSNFNEREPRKLVALVEQVANSEGVFRRVRLILERAANRERSHRYGENLMETMDYILSKEKCGREGFLKLRAKLGVSPALSKGRVGLDYARVNAVIFSSELNKISRLLAEGSDEVHLALLRIYYAEGEDSDRKQFEGGSFRGSDLLLSLRRYYVESFEDQNDLFEETKHPLFRLLKNHLLLFFSPFLHRFHAAVARLATKGDADSPYAFYKGSEALLREELSSLVLAFPFDLLLLLNSLFIIVADVYKAESECAVGMVKKLLFFSFLCSQSVIEEVLPLVDPSKHSSTYNNVINLFFAGSPKKLADLPPQKLVLVRSLTEEISSQLDTRICSPSSQVLEEGEIFPLSFSLRDPILNHDYELLSHALERIEFTPKDMKKFTMWRQDDKPAVDSPLRTHFAQPSVLLQSEGQGETELAAWMSVGGSRQWGREASREGSGVRVRGSVRERLAGLGGLLGPKVAELNFLKSEFEQYLG